MRVRPDNRSNSSLNSWQYCVILFICLLVSILGISVPVWADQPGTDSQDYPRAVTDDQQISITLTAAPERIISLAPSNTEILYALGLGDRIVGVTDYCNYPVEAGEKDTIGGFSTVSIEKVVALTPDLVVGSDGNNPEAIERLRGMGIPVYIVDAKSMGDVQKTITNLGYLAGIADQARDLNENLTARAETVAGISGTMSVHPSIAHVVWHDPIYVSGAGTFQDELIHLCGGVNAFGSREDHVITGVEEFISLNPDILLINSGSGMGGSDSEIAQYFRTEPRLTKLKAVTQDHIIIVDTNIADRAGPRLWDLLEQVAPQIREMT